VHMPLQNFNSSLWSNGDIAFVEIYATRCFSQTSRIVDGLPVFTELSLSAFEFIAQLRCLHRVPLRVLSSHIRFRRRRRCWFFFVNSAHDGNQAETAQFFEIVIRPNLRI